ncbi:MAG TPA: hypothetical protein VMR34_01005 [Candidatus Saccharimonadales bacterium]|nr:hypothetical protein [Candidatus Saccharimonadales bacterium]
MENLDKKDLLVVKVGTNLLVDKTQDQEKLNDNSFIHIGSQALELTESGYGVVIVSSGAVTAGVISDGKKRDGTEEMVELQRYAARGWDSVVKAWKRAIGSNRVSSTLLTKRELRDQKTRKSALGVIACCLGHQDIFIVNENDTISDDELKYGNNDTLAGELASTLAVAGIFKSARLVLLTDKSGLNRDKNDDSTLIRVVSDIESVRLYADDSGDINSKGGMLTKLNAAEHAKFFGIETFIAGGAEDSSITRAVSGEIGTRFKI